MTGPDEQDLLRPPDGRRRPCRGSLERQRATFAWKADGPEDKRLAGAARGGRVCQGVPRYLGVIAA